jgi:DNA-binding NtrC family response regulator
VLLVDDEAAVLAVLARALEAAGYATVRALSAKEALVLLSDAAPGSINAVLSDVRMPETSGIELALEIRRSWPDLPIALMSAYEPPELLAGHQSLVNVPLLQKPFALPSVLELVREAVGPGTRRAG